MAKSDKMLHFSVFPISRAYKGRFTITWLTTPLTHFTWEKQGFSEPPDRSADY